MNVLGALKLVLDVVQIAGVVKEEITKPIPTQQELEAIERSHARYVKKQRSSRVFRVKATLLSFAEIPEGWGLFMYFINFMWFFGILVFILVSTSTFVSCMVPFMKFNFLSFLLKSFFLNLEIQLNNNIASFDECSGYTIGFLSVIIAPIVMLKFF